jgi:hypothetical protein
MATEEPMPWVLCTSKSFLTPFVVATRFAQSYEGVLLTRKSMLDRLILCSKGQSLQNSRNGKGAGISHPSVHQQEAVIRAAYAQAGLDFSLTRYAECHGTGTSVGDPIEVDAIGRVFARYRSPTDPLLIGSVKTNVSLPFRLPLVAFFLTKRKG